MAQNAVEAFSIHQEWRPTLVISDWNLSAEETAEQFVRKVSKKSFVIVMISDNVEDQALEAGARAFLSKPVNIAALN